MKEIDGKICKKCLIYKNIDQFSKNGKYYRNICKDCVAKYQQEYQENNKEQINKQKKEYYESNKDKIKIQKKEYYENNKNQIKEYKKEYRENNKDKNKKYREDNKEKIKNKRKEYQVNNKDKIRNKQKEYRENNKNKINEHTKKRRNDDPVFALRHNFSTLFNKNIKNMGLSKNGNSCFDVLDYNFDKLKTNLESKFEPWMNWGNYGKYNPKTWKDDDPSTHTWNLDHLDPQANLPYTNFEDENFKKCWSLDNLRPYSAKQNFLDGTSRVRHKKKK